MTHTAVLLYLRTVWSKMTKEQKQDAVLSCALTAVFFALVIGIWGVWYRTNDDAILSNIAFGAYGSDRVHLVYVNLLYGWLLRGLQCLNDSLNWFALSQVGPLYASTAVLTYYGIRHWGRLRGAVLAAAMMAAFGANVLFRIQYTQTAALALCAGLVVLLENLGKKSRANLLGLALVLLGAMLRFDMFFAVGGLSAWVLLQRFIRLDKPEKKRALTVAAAMFCLVFGAKLVDRAAYLTDPEWASYLPYNAARTEFSDFKSNFLSEENTLSDIGVTDAEYTQLLRWDFYDPENFTAQRLQKISDHIPGHDLMGALRAMGGYIRTLGGSPYNRGAAVMLLLCLGLAAASGQPGSVLCTLGVTAAELLLLCYVNRLPEWVGMPLVLDAVIFAMASLANGNKQKRLVERRCTLALAAAAAAMVVIAVPTCHDLTASRQALQQLAQGEENYLTAMSADKEHLYLLSSEKTTEINGYLVWHPREKGFFSNIVTQGGWYNGTPQYLQTLKNYGMANPLRDAVDRSDVYVDYHGIDALCSYLREQTGKTVTAVPDGGNAFAPYHLKTE